jgi:hypothetical protein
MKKILLILAVLFLTPHIFIGQSNYIKGGIITLKKDTLLGFVDDQEWIRNPVQITFKVNQNAKEQQFKPEQISGFFISASNEIYLSKAIVFEKFSRNIDKSAFFDTEEYNLREKNIQSKTVFLKVVSSGKTNLYEFIDNDHENYFFIENENKLASLVYHYFLIKSSIQQVNEYQNQLESLFSNCSKMNGYSFNLLKYEVKSLKKAVDTFNHCMSLNTVNKKIENSFIKHFEIGLMAGLGFSTLQYNVEKEVKFSWNTNQQIGIFINYILPRLREKLVFQNEFHNYRYDCTGSDNFPNSPTEFTIKMSYLCMKNTIRYTFYKKNIGIYALLGISNGILLKNESFKKTLNLATIPLDSQNFGREQAFVLGLGVNFNKISLESRYTRGNSFLPFTNDNSPLKEISIFLKYRLN